MTNPIAPAKDGGVAFAFPDVCKTPLGSSDVPLPYPNIAQLIEDELEDKSFITKSEVCELVVGQEEHHVLLEGAVVKKSTGDEAGSKGGVISDNIQGPCRIVKAENGGASATVVYGPGEGKGIVRFMDKTEQNLDAEKEKVNASGVVLSSFPSVVVGD